MESIQAATDRQLYESYQLFGVMPCCRALFNTLLLLLLL
jgi:hypothetical protein